jgi:hypothetical protein
MNMSRRGIVLVVVQCVLVLSTAGKYLWERHTCPAVWSRVELFNQDRLQVMARDPDDRYMEVQLLADACGLPARTPEEESDINLAEEERGIYERHPVRKDRVRTIARDGKLMVEEAETPAVHDGQQMYWDLRRPCTEARLLEIVKFYVPSAEAMPTQLKSGDSVWALVTVPKQGPPRPIKLAVSDATGFHPLDMK